MARCGDTKGYAMTAGLTLFFVWLRLRWLAFVRPDASFKVRMAATLMILPLVVYPFTYGPVWWLRGLTGDLSITSIVLLAFAIAEKLSGKAMFAGDERLWLYRAIALVGLVFYPLALGIGQFDPYALGYDAYLAYALLVLALLLFWQHFYHIAGLLLVVVLAWNIQLLSSPNLWDYLLDPFVFFYAWWRVLRCKV